MLCNAQESPGSTVEQLQAQLADALNVIQQMKAAGTSLSTPSPSPSTAATTSPSVPQSVEKLKPGVPGKAPADEACFCGLHMLYIIGCGVFLFSVICCDTLRPAVYIYIHCPRNRSTTAFRSMMMMRLHTLPR